MSLIAGFDYDSNTISIVTLDVDTDEAHWHERRLDLGPGDSFARARRVRDVMPARAHWADSGVVMVAIEATLSRQRNAIGALSRVQGAILACIPRELDVLPLSAQKWKYETVGKAKAPKEDVAVWVTARWSNQPEDATQDALDAYAIAWAARSLCEKAAAAA